MGLKLLFGGSSSKDEGLIEIIQLDSQTKMETGDYLVLSNALYQKGLTSSKELLEALNLFEQGQLSEPELHTAIIKSNKQMTYYYLVAIQNPSSDVITTLGEDLEYQFYLMRKGSEELLKYTADASTLRVDVGRDLLTQAVQNENAVNTEVATAFARYDIDPNTVVVDPSIWDKEYTFIQQQPDMVIFKDLEASEQNGYAYYLRHVNDDFMLVSWEIQNMYLAKLDYERGDITADQLSSILDRSGFIINRVYEDSKILLAPEGLGQLGEDTQKTMILYHDALLEIQKFRMTTNVDHFDDAMVIIHQADAEAGRIGEFIYAVRQQYGL